MWVSVRLEEEDCAEQFRPFGGNSGAIDSQDDFLSLAGFSGSRCWGGVCYAEYLLGISA